MPDRPQRIALGFLAGIPLSLRMRPEKVEALRGQLTSGQTGFHDVETEDGVVLVNLAQVIYLRVESDEQRVGF